MIESGYMLKVEGLSKKYNKKQVLNDLSFEVPEGSIYTLVGGYGEGKTTLLNIIAGYSKADRGNIYIKDVDCISQSSKAKKMFGFVPDKFPVYDELTGKEYLEFFGKIMSNKDDEQVRHLTVNLLGFVGLSKYIDVRIKKYNYSMKQKLSIARALLHNPKLLILDEPFYGLDADNVKEIKEILDFLHEQGRTIFMTSDNLNLSASISTAVGIMENGSMLSGDRIRKAYANLVSQSRMREITIRGGMLKERTKNLSVEEENDSFDFEDESAALERNREVTRSPQIEKELNNTMHQMPNINNTMHQMPNINNTMHQMPDINNTMHQMPNINNTMHQMPNINNTMHQMPDINNTIHQMPNINNTMHHIPNINNRVPEPIKMPYEEVKKIHNSATANNLNGRIHKDNRINVEKRGAGGSRVVTNKDNLRKNRHK